jgi:hypothetical protein
MPYSPIEDDPINPMEDRSIYRAYRRTRDISSLVIGALVLGVLIAAFLAFTMGAFNSDRPGLRIGPSQSNIDAPGKEWAFLAARISSHSP